MTTWHILFLEEACLTTGLIRSKSKYTLTTFCRTRYLGGACYFIVALFDISDSNRDSIINWDGIRICVHRCLVCSRLFTFRRIVCVVLGISSTVLLSRLAKINSEAEAAITKITSVNTIVVLLFFDLFNFEL